MNYILIAVAFVILSGLSGLYTHVSPDLEKTSGGKLGFDSLVKTKINKPTRNHHQSKSLPCPDNVYPCVCSVDNEYGVILDCTDVTTESELRSIFDREFPFPDMAEFQMDRNTDCEIVKLPNGIFQSKTFQRMNFHDVNFTISLDCFDNMTHTLEYFHFHTIITSPPVQFNKDFTHFTKLDYIYFYVTNAPIEEFYLSSPTLTSLYVYGNYSQGFDSEEPYNLGPMGNLEYLNVNHLNRVGLSQAPDTSGYPKLKQLYIYYNNISFLNTTEWMTRSYLDKFAAADNAIQDIEVGFLRVAVSAGVSFHNNQLTHLEEDKWKDIFINASYIYLYANPFVCGCDIAWLFQNTTDGSLFVDKIDDGATCATGENFHDLDPGVWQALCPV